MSIHDYTQKIKGFAQSPQGRDMAVVSIVILTGIICFVLGRLSIGQEKGSGVVITGGANTIGTTLVDPNRTMQPNIATNSTDSGSLSVQNTIQPGSGDGLYVASSRGKKYYPVDCPAASGLSKKNLVYYKTAFDAEKAGKTLSTSCN
jgi:hypothetical protein